MSMATDPVRFDLEIEVPPYPRVTVRALPGQRGWTNNPEGLQRLNTFYEELFFLLPATCRHRGLEGELEVSVLIWQRHRRSDLDNVIKSLFDGITKAGIWKDDRQVRAVKAARAGFGSSRVIVEIRSFELSRWVGDEVRAAS